MIILLFGKDTYRSRKELKRLLGQHRRNKTKIESFEAIKTNYRNFKDQVRQTSMFTDNKLVVLRGFFSNKQFKEEFLKDAEQWDQSNDVIVIYEEDKISKRDKLLKFVKENGDWKQFEPLTGNKLKDWFSQQFKKNEVEIDSQALSTLVSFVGNDLWRASNEIQKLIDYKQKETITERDVELLVRPDLETDIFKTIDAFALKDKDQALNLIQRHLNQGDSPLYILHMINYQLRNLLAVKQLSQQGKSFSAIKKHTGLHPYVVKKSLRQCDKFDLEEIKNIYHQLLEVDLNIKTGKVDKEPALKSFVAKI